jgi:hypothetical protein
MRLLLKGLPAQIGSEALPMTRLRCQANGHIAKENQGDIQLPRQVVRHRNRRGRCFRQKPAVSPQRTELYRETTLVGIALALDYLGSV